MSNAPDFRRNYLNSKRIINLNYSIFDDLKCSICLEFLKNPRTLNCQHSFCTKCLEPLVMQKVFNCPECRNSNYFESLEKIPKNIVLSNLVNNLNSNKAVCPECNTIDDLFSCDHCSHIFCRKCVDIHFQKLFDQFDSCISKLESFPKLIDEFKTAIDKSEEEIFSQTIKKMEDVQTHILNLWHSRKSTLFEEIRRFHKNKKEEIEIAKFRFQVLSKNLNELVIKKNNLAKEFKTSLNQGKLMKELVEFEKELNLLDVKFKEDFSNIKIDSLKMVLNYNQTDNIEVFKKILDTVSLTTKFNSDTIINRDDQKIKNFVKIEDFLGKSMKLEFDPEFQEIAIIQLKCKLKKELAIDENTTIELLDKKTFKTLEDNSVLIFKDGKFFLKKSLSPMLKEKQLTRRNLHSSSVSSTEASNFSKQFSNLTEDEIELIISYRFSYDN